MGILYNTDTWTWSFAQKKANKILAAVDEILNNRSVKKSLLDSLVGRINFYHPIIGPQAKYERGFLIKAANEGTFHDQAIRCTANMVSQAAWWRRNVIAALEYSRIPDPGSWEPQDTILIYPDAAGGANLRDGRGAGVVVEFNNICYWSFLANSEMIMENARAKDGTRLGHKLSFLELIAALLGLTVFPDIIRNRHVTVMTDNIGAVFAYKKGYSTDVYSYTVAKALDVVARGLNCTLVVKKTPRRSSRGEQIADHLSKGEFDTAKELMGPGHQLRFPPKTLVKYMDSPTVTRVLGSAILRELSDYLEVLTPEVEWDWEVENLTKRMKRKVDWRLLQPERKRRRKCE